ncbi:MAG: cupin domain-containing protein [Gemmatimonadaceae bacterium]
MKALDPASAALAAVAPNPTKPATAVLHDTDDLRLVVFRIAPGQSVPPHRSVSSVMLTVLGGEGILSGEENGQIVERRFTAGEAATYAPDELHAMRSDSTELLLLATITPRPGSR